MKTPEDADPVDIHVEKRLCVRRQELGLTQKILAKRAGVSYQQLQKYEAAVNRISASKLFKLGCILGVPPAWFFEGLTPDALPSEPADSAPPQWLRLWSQIAALPPGIRNAYIAFGKSLSHRLAR